MLDERMRAAPDGTDLFMCLGNLTSQSEPRCDMNPGTTSKTRAHGGEGPYIPIQNV